MNIIIKKSCILIYTFLEIFPERVVQNVLYKNEIFFKIDLILQLVIFPYCSNIMHF